MRKTLRIGIVGALIIVVLVAIVILQACNRSEPESAGAPHAGGLVTESGGVSVAEAPPATATPAPFIFAEGDVYTPPQQVALFAAAASSATVLDVYAPGTTFTVLEPSGDYIDYPVSSGGTSWVRVRAIDGLAGWTRAETLLSSAQSN